MKFCKSVEEGQISSLSQKINRGLSPNQSVNMFQTILRLSVAGALGALVALELGKNVSDNPVALVVFAAISSLVGFILVGPKAFFAELLEQTVEAFEELARKKRERQLRREMRRERLNDPLFANLYALLMVYHATYATSILLWTTWISTGFFWLLRNIELNERLLPAWTVMEIVFVALFSIVGYFAYRDDRESCLQKDEGEIKGLEAKLNNSITHSKVFLFSGLAGPFWILWQMLRGIWWCIGNIGFFVRSLLIILAKTCRFVASMERWCAAVGAIVGFIVGWRHGKSEVVAMLMGGLVGNGISVVSNLFLQILPDPDSEWPKLAKANA